MTDPDYMTRMQHDDDSLSSSDLISLYEKGIEELRNAVAGMTAEQSRMRPIPGKWSTVEVVSHLAGSELFFTDRIERTIAMERPLLIGVDEKPYPERMNYQDLDLTEELEMFCALRRHMARALRLQPAEAWKRPAVHSHSGLVTLRQLLFQPTRHLRHHLPFIAEKRAALKHV
jgi:DinB superfamily